MKLFPIAFSLLGGVMLAKAEGDVQRTIGAVVLGTGMSRMLNEAIDVERDEADQVVRSTQQVGGRTPAQPKRGV